MSYDAVHDRLKREKGKASTHLCACGKPALDWAYQHSGAGLTDPQGRRYSDDPNDYAPMCRSCHTALDREHDPGWDQAVRDQARKIGTRPRDPEEQARLGRLGMAAADATPEMKAHKKAIALLNRTARRRCGECGTVFARTGMGRHQQVSGHRGYEDLS